MPAKKVAKRQVECEDCSYRFESREARPHCGKCGSYRIKELGAIQKIKEEDEEGPQKIVEYKGPLTAHFSGQELALAEVLINAGLAKNFHDLMKKSLRVTAASANLNSIIGGAIMQNPGEKKEPDDPEKEMDKLEAMEVRELSLQKIKERLKRGDSLDSKELMEMIKTRQALKMLKDLDKEDGDFGFKEMLQYQLFQSMTQNKSNTGDSDVVKAIKELKEALRESKQEEKMRTLTNSIESKFSAIEGKLGKSGSDDIKQIKEFMTDIEKIREQGRAELEKSRTEFQTERELRHKQDFEHKLLDTERKIQELAEKAQPGRGLKTEIQEVKEAIIALKEVSKEFSGEPKQGKDAGEVIIDIIDKTTKNIVPIAERYLQDKANRPPSYPQPPPVYHQTHNEQEAVISEEIEPITAEEEIANAMHQQQTFPKKETK